MVAIEQFICPWVKLALRHMPLPGLAAMLVSETSKYGWQPFVMLAIR